MEQEFYLVHNSILPPYLKTVMEARELIEAQRLNVSDACKLKQISRSTYYKYKDYVFHVRKSESQMAILSLRVLDKKGVLSSVLNMISHHHGNIMSINQDIPINNIAYINICLNVVEMNVSINDLIKNLENIEGVKLVQLLAME